MSWRMVQWVRDSVVIKPPACKLVLMVIATYANDEGMAWMGVEAIAQDCGLTDRSVGRYLVALEDAGLITRQRRYTRGLIRQTDVFEINDQWEPGGQQPLFDDLPKDQKSSGGRRKAGSQAGKGKVTRHGCRTPYPTPVSDKVPDTDGKVTRHNEQSYPTPVSGTYKESNKKGQRKNSPPEGGMLIDNGLIDGVYYYKAEIIRLTKKDYKKWESDYPDLDLDAELDRYDAFLARQPRGEDGWFLRTKNHFSNLNREARERRIAEDKF